MFFVTMCLRYFNPRSHERSDKDYLSKYCYAIISIHAPTRGATKNVLKSPVKALISIHAPTRGATLLLYPFSACHSHFNPRSHERSDRTTEPQKDLAEISIHAPTRGATKWGVIFNYIFPNFNPRSHERSDYSGAYSLLGDFDFNPRSHERSDEERIAELDKKIISIHAPTRGATCLGTLSVHSRKDFNPRSHERSDADESCNTAQQEISIHAPTRGATDISDLFAVNIIFQSTLPREERLRRWRYVWFRLISIHAPTRGATC